MINFRCEVQGIDFTSELNRLTMQLKERITEININILTGSDTIKNLTQMNSILTLLSNLKKL